MDYLWLASRLACKHDLELIINTSDVTFDALKQQYDKVHNSDTL